MDNFRAIPQMAEALQDMIAKGQARLATVTAVYPNEVDASLSDGSVARFATTHNGLAVGQKGVLINATGGAKIFTPLGIAVPRSYYLTNTTAPFATATTAGVYLATQAATVATGLVPGREYTVIGTVEVQTGFETTIRRFQPVLRASGLTTVDSLAMNYLADRPNDAASGAVFAKVKANANGEITLTPGFKWSEGTVTGRWVQAVIEVK